MNNQRRKEVLLTYSEWERIFERRVKLYMGRKLHDFMYGYSPFPFAGCAALAYDGTLHSNGLLKGCVSDGYDSEFI